MKINFAASVVLLLSFAAVSGLGKGSGSAKTDDKITCVGMDKDGYFTLDKVAMDELIHNKPFKVRIDTKSDYSNCGSQASAAMLNVTGNIVGVTVQKNTGRILYPCANAHLLPTFTYTIGGKNFVLPPSKYKTNVKNLPSGTCGLIFVDDSINPRIGGVRTLVWGRPSINYFKIKVDKTKNQVCLQQPK